MDVIDTKFKKELKDVLMEARAATTKPAYHVIRAEGQNITVLLPGLNGSEYNKTYGHFHKYNSVEIYNCLYGQGLVIMQRNDEEGQAKEYKVVGLHPGKQVEVPAGFGHGLVNVGKVLLAVLDNAPEGSKAHNYEPVKQKKGFAYYVVEKKGEIGFEKNPAYRVHPQITTE